MHQKQIIAGAFVAILSSGVAISAQTPPQTPQQTPQQTEPRAAADRPATVVTGCIYREEDVPGRAPNVAERAGVLEDYILVASAAEGATGAAGAATPGATGTSGRAQPKAGSMYKLEIESGERLRAMVGKRVEVTGRVDAEAGDSTATPSTAPKTSQTDKVLGRDRIDLPEFEVSSMREVSGSCPSKPAAQ